MFYVISYENGVIKTGNFNSYSDCLNYAESYEYGFDFTIDEYLSEEDFFNNY